MILSHYYFGMFQVYDAGENFQLCQLTYADGERDDADPLWQVIVIKPEGIKANDPNR